MDTTERDDERRRGAAAAQARALGSPLLHLIVGGGRDFGAPEWAHVVRILGLHMDLQRRQEQRAVDAAMGVEVATLPLNAEVTLRVGATAAGQSLLAEFGRFDAGDWPDVRAILSQYDDLVTLRAEAAAWPEPAAPSEPLDVATYRARKQEAPESGEE